MPRFWQDHKDSIRKHIIKDMFTTRRLLRLRTYMYWKVNWIETNNMVNWFLENDLLREVRREKNWLAPLRYLDLQSNVLGMYYDEFEKKRDIYEKWVEAAHRNAGFSEDIVREGIKKAGFTAQRVVFDVPDNFFDDSSDQKSVEIDAYCVGHDMKLGVEVKNITSDVFINPDVISTPNRSIRQLMHRFEYCRKNKIVPILHAPLIDGSFYVYCDNNKGLLCRTLFQYFSEDYLDLCEDIKKHLGYGHVKAVSELPERYVNWYKRVPKMWNDRHGNWEY